MEGKDIPLREQLIKLIIKIDRKVHGNYDKMRVIESVKTEVPSSLELTNCIISIESRYSWSSPKMMVEIMKSFCLNILLGYGLFIMDVGTDIYFTYQMFERKDVNLKKRCMEFHFWV